MIAARTDGRVAVVTIDRHDKRNALDPDHLILLEAAVQQAVSDDHRAMVITGAGSAFCSGADLGGVYGNGFRTALYGALGAITAAPIPVVAAVNGPAIGAGTQLAIACDLRVASPTATFAVPTARNGLAVDPWTVRRLAVLAGGATARALLLACDTFDAGQARTRGLADQLGDFDDALAVAHRIATYAPLSLSYSKHALETLLEPASWPDELAEEFDKCWNSGDFEESKLARAQGRSPEFVGR